MNETVSKMSEEQVRFIENELGVKKEQLENSNLDELGEIYDKLVDIETDEITEGFVSERCRIAGDLVSLIGNDLFTDDDTDEDEE